MFRKIKRKWGSLHLSIGLKLTLGLLSIAAVLLLSSVISVLQYSSMSNYVSSLIAGNIRNIDYLEKLSDDIQSYTTQVMAVLWDDDLTEAPELNIAQDRAFCDSLRTHATTPEIQAQADSLARSFNAFAWRSLQLPEIVVSTESTLDWYNLELKPLYDDFRARVFEMNDLIYEDLKANSATFDRGYYRSVIPFAVAIAVGLLLVLLLLLFSLAYYIRPLRRMLRGLEDYNQQGKRYINTFDGDDELQRLNEGITDIVSENLLLKKRVSHLKQRLSNENK